MGQGRVLARLGWAGEKRKLRALEDQTRRPLEEINERAWKATAMERLAIESGER